jgi:hypothetical protein
VLNYRNTQPYVDYTPGAFAPVSFVADNSTLKGGNSTWGWRRQSGYLYAAPVESTLTSAGQHSGLQWVTEGKVSRLYWNQTKWKSGASGSVLLSPSADNGLACSTK